MKLRGSPFIGGKAQHAHLPLESLRVYAVETLIANEGDAPELSARIRKEQNLRPLMKPGFTPYATAPI